MNKLYYFDNYTMQEFNSNLQYSLHCRPHTAVLTLCLAPYL